MRGLSPLIIIHDQNRDVNGTTVQQKGISIYLICNIVPVTVMLCFLDIRVLLISYALQYESHFAETSQHVDRLIRI